MNIKYLQGGTNRRAGYAAVSSYYINSAMLSFISRLGAFQGDISLPKGKKFRLSNSLD